MLPCSTPDNTPGGKIMAHSKINTHGTSGEVSVHLKSSYNKSKYSETSVHLQDFYTKKNYKKFFNVPK